MNDDEHLGDPYEQAEAEAEALRLAREAELTDLRSTIIDPPGRRAVWRVIAASGAFSNPYRPGAADNTAYACGAMSIGQWMLAECAAASPEYYNLMMKENGHA